MVMGLFAAAPIALVLALMVGPKWGSTRAGPAGWAAALGIAYSAFGADPALLVYSQLKGLLLSLYVLYIVWFALALYRVVDEAGALASISAAVARLTGDRLMQLLVLCWVFSSLLQGVTGFGVPVAVVAPLLVGLGFSPATSVVATSIGHGWAVTFGSLASAFFAMVAVTGRDGADLAPATAALLGVVCLLCGIVPAWLHGRWAGLRHGWPAVAVIGLAMAGAQYVLAVNGIWSLASFGGGCAGLAAAAVVARLPRYRRGRSGGGSGETIARELLGERQSEGARLPRETRHNGPSGERGQSDTASSTLMPLPLAFLAYLVLVTIVVAVALVPGLAEVLDRVEVTVPFPATRTALGWENVAGPGRAISVFGHAGALIAYACAITFAIYRRLGRYRPGAGGRIVAATVRGSALPTVGIVFLVGMASAMNDAGMTFALAEAIGRAAGPAYPIAGPFIAVLGAFVTGSNTNSNVLFAPLQQHTAAILGLNAAVVLGMQNVGGAVGSVFAPAKLVVGVSTVGLAGAEGEVVRRTVLFGGLVVGVVGLLAWVLG